MKEKIYTIPVSEAFEQECECPVCVLEKRLENEYTDYYLGAALMEPDCRMETNKKGFCRRHFEMLYNRQENRLGLALETHTHLKEQIEKLKKLAKAADDDFKSAKTSDSLLGALTRKFTSKSKDDNEAASKLLEMLTNLENSCTICGKLNYTMDRYMDVIMYLWSHEQDFRKLFASKKGFCLVHLKQLIDASIKYLKPSESKPFLSLLLKQQLENMDRLENELDWFTKKFDYRNTDAPWHNSKDALPRNIQKLKGYSNI